jgi:ribosomal protein S18 acetylase RimI-like enzyme
MRRRPDAVGFRPGEPDAINVCVNIWAAACRMRDGRETVGLAEEARARFDDGVVWIVSERGNRLAGFVLCTVPGPEQPTDPPNAPAVSMLAVAPGHQGLGVGGGLLRQAVAALADQGYFQAVLHVFTDNHDAVGLCERGGWQRTGGEIMIDPSGQRPSWTYQR